MDTRYDHPANQINSTARGALLRAAMAQSDRDVEAGETVPLAEVLAELDEAVEQLEVRLRARPT